MPSISDASIEAMLEAVFGSDGLTTIQPEVGESTLRADPR